MFQLIDNSERTLARISFEPYEFRITSAGEAASVDLEQLLGPVVRAQSVDAENASSQPDGGVELPHERLMDARPAQQQRLIASAIDAAEMPLGIVRADAQLASRYDEGDVVDSPDGIGVVTDVITENKETDAEGFDDIEASESSPMYVLVTERTDADGISLFRASDLEAAEIETDIDPLGAAKEEAEATEAMLSALAPGDGRFETPPSWRKSDTPTRVIALKAFAGMGGSFDGCVREMRGNVASPDAFCGAFLDRVLGYEEWRGDSPLPGD